VEGVLHSFQEDDIPFFDEEEILTEVEKPREISGQAHGLEVCSSSALLSAVVFEKLPDKMIECLVYSFDYFISPFLFLVFLLKHVLI